MRVERLNIRSRSHNGQYSLFFAPNAKIYCKSTVHNCIFFKIQVRVHYQKYVKTRIICRPLIRRNFSSFATTDMKNGATRQAIIEMLVRRLQNEVASLCSIKSKSVFGKKPSDGMGNFIDTIKTVMEEMQLEYLLYCHY